MRRTTGPAALVTAAALLLTACGGDDSDSGDAATVTTDSGIEVEGEAGVKPTLTIPESDPPKDLVVEVLEEGDGTEVGADDFVVADYLGQTWEPKEDAPDEPNVFDTSYSEDRGPTGFPLNGVITGWKEGLAGQKVGSRVLLTIPPEKGYGDQGTTDGSVPANATLAFVVEVKETFRSGTAASGEKVDDVPAGLPAVSGGEDGTAPTLDFANAKEPSESSATLLVQGDGEKVRDNLVLNLVQASYPDGADAQNSWDLKAPQGLAVADLANFPGGLADVAGKATVGSRIITAVAAKDNPGQDGKPGSPFVLLLDIVGTY